MKHTALHYRRERKNGTHSTAMSRRHCSRAVFLVVDMFDIVGSVDSSRSHVWELVRSVNA